jgi:hypothetical protein
VDLPAHYATFMPFTDFGLAVDCYRCSVKQIEDTTQPVVEGNAT